MSVRTERDDDTGQGILVPDAPPLQIRTRTLHLSDACAANGREYHSLCGRWVRTWELAPGLEAVTCAACRAAQAEIDAVEL